MKSLIEAMDSTITTIKHGADENTTGYGLLNESKSYHLSIGGPPDLCLVLSEYACLAITLKVIFPATTDQKMADRLNRHLKVKIKGPLPVSTHA